MPKPDRKPWSRWTSTETPFGLRSSIAILACLPSASNFALAHCPIRLPAWKLSVAKVASAASGGSTGVSSAMTSIPACLALSSDGTIALESFAVIMKPLAPAEIRFSMAWTWDSLSPSCLPAKDCSCTPACWAAWRRALLHLHEERVGVGLGDQADDHLFARGGAAGPPDPLELDDPPPPHAASTREAVRPVAITAARRPPGEMGFRTGETSRLHRPGSMGWTTSRGQRCRRSVRHATLSGKRGSGQAESRFRNDHRRGKLRG